MRISFWYILYTNEKLNLIVSQKYSMAIVFTVKIGIDELRILKLIHLNKPTVIDEIINNNLHDKIFISFNLNRGFVTSTQSPLDRYTT